MAFVALCTWKAQCASKARVFVDSFGDKPGASMLRERVIKLLGKQAGIAVVTEASQADYVLTGSGETYIKGYMGMNPRVRYLNSDAQPVLGGFLSIELKPPGQDTIWSYLVTPKRIGSQDIYRNLAGQAIPRLLEAIKQQGKP